MSQLGHASGCTFRLCVGLLPEEKKGAQILKRKLMTLLVGVAVLSGAGIARADDVASTDAQKQPPYQWY
jgi:hypothetical protein